MIPPTDPVYLAERSYRRRRLIDAARLLPFAAALLFFAPAVLVPGGTYSGLTRLGLYFFGTWFLLIGITLLIARAIERRAALEDTEPAPHRAPQ